MLIRTVIAADYPLLREGLRRILEADTGIEIIAEVGGGQGAINVTRNMKFDILLIDFNILRESGLEVVRVIRREYPRIGIIVLMADVADEKINQILQIGVAGCLLKYADSQALLRSIYKVFSGEPLLPPTVVGNLPGQLRQKKAFENTFNLSEREMEILNYLVKGSSNKEIGLALFISEKTVKNHLSSIYRKLAVGDRTQAALKAVKLKLFQLD